MEMVFITRSRLGNDHGMAARPGSIRDRIQGMDTSRQGISAGELRKILADVDDSARITCSPGGGMLTAVTPTANGFVILDATPKGVSDV